MGFSVKRAPTAPAPSHPPPSTENIYPRPAPPLSQHLLTLNPDCLGRDHQNLVSWGDQILDTLHPPLLFRGPNLTKGES